MSIRVFKCYACGADVSENQSLARSTTGYIVRNNRIEEEVEVVQYKCKQCACDMMVNASDLKVSKKLDMDSYGGQFRTQKFEAVYVDRYLNVIKGSESVCAQVDRGFQKIKVINICAG